MLPLVRILFDIVLLRRGPDDLPRSVILLGMTILLWVFSVLVALVLIGSFDEADFFISMFSALVGVLCYMAIVQLAGYPARVLQTVSAVLGTGALITLVFVAAYVLLLPLAGEADAALVATLLVFWSIPVEGHIVSRAIDRHWYIGILLAVFVFIIQFGLNIVVASGR